MLQEGGRGCWTGRWERLDSEGEARGSPSPAPASTAAKPHGKQCHPGVGPRANAESMPTAQAQPLCPRLPRSPPHCLLNKWMPEGGRGQLKLSRRAHSVLRTL